jgi:hypothetical protein
MLGYQQTCKSIYDILKSSSLLAYTLQLHYDGLKEVGTPPSSHFELAESLLRRRQAWFSVKWPGLTTYRMQRTVQAYEFVGGAFAVTDGHNLEVVWLPTSNNINVKHLKFQNLTGLEIRDITMDPTQDMIVLLEAAVSTSALLFNAISTLIARPTVTGRAWQFSHPYSHHIHQCRPSTRTRGYFTL